MKNYVNVWENMGNSQEQIKLTRITKRRESCIVDAQRK